MLSPSDIAAKEFAKSLNGYNRNEVDDYMAKVSESFEAVVRELDYLKQQIAESDKKIADYQAQENSLKEALLVAQITSNDIKKKAELEAESVVKNAEASATQIVSESKAEAEDILQRAKRDADKNLDMAKEEFKEIQQATVLLKKDYVDFRDKYQYVLREQISILDQLVVKDELTD